MAIGWIRAYGEEDKAMEDLDRFVERDDRARFRDSFRTQLRAERRESSDRLKTLKWSDEVELPNGLARGTWTSVVSGTKEGFVKSAHLVELAWVKRGRKTKYRDGLSTEIKLKNGDKAKLLWGDLVQIIEPGDDLCQIRARGQESTIDPDNLMDTALLEVYFVDVGQGDGVLVRTPDGRHMVIDGGLERVKQLTGKNAADFVDWKFFFDYGDSRIRLDSLMASHSDNDHYGGLHDLVRTGTVADRELDCLGVDIKTFHHPGLSRWSTPDDSGPLHSQGLGASTEDAFTWLLEDRSHAEKSLKRDADEKLSGPWSWFIRDVLANSTKTKVQRVLLDRDKLQSGSTLPKFWPSKMDCDILVLGPVGITVDGKPALPDFGKKSFNTNGHSICLRVDYGDARILLTGDLNSESMKWLAACFGDRMGAWECDVAKACHHGSHDISYAFLEKMKPAATVISSGDAEGHAHPRPEIVGASAVTGYAHVDRDEDKLISPLIYMTEIERSVSLGALNRIDFRNLPIDGTETDGAILGRHVDELNDKAFLTPEARREHDRIADSDDRSDFAEDFAAEEKPNLQPMEGDMITGRIKVDFNLTVPQGPVSTANVRKRAWRSRIMEKNHYGLVNVRTDGETVMCATLDETEHKWVTHSFPARFGPPGV